MKNSILFLVAALAIVIAVFSYLFIVEEEIAEHKVANTQLQSDALDKKDSNNQAIATTKTNASSVAASSRSYSKIEWNTPAGMQQVKNWQQSRGYFPDADLLIYKSYDSETIQNLAKDGDIKAIYALAESQISKGKQGGEIIATYIDAAVLGSSKALGLIGSISTPSRDFPEFNGVDGYEKFKDKMIDALAYFEAGLLRGDKLMLHHIEQATRNFDLDATDKEQISKRAQAIYQDLEKKRIEKGLGEFDNTVPDIVNQYFEAEKATIEDR